MAIESKRAGWVRFRVEDWLEFWVGEDLDSALTSGKKDFLAAVTKSNLVCLYRLLVGGDWG